jgi:hypothetical protein
MCIGKSFFVIPFLIAPPPPFEDEIQQILSEMY